MDPPSCLCFNLRRYRRAQDFRDRQGYLGGHNLYFSSGIQGISGTSKIKVPDFFYLC
jgi:hypothetical protein